MKKVIYFLMLMSAMTILNIGCEKPADSDTTITAANLVGDFDFQSLTNATGTYNIPLSKADSTYLETIYGDYGIINVGVREKSGEPNKYEISLNYKSVAYFDFTVSENILNILQYNFTAEILKFDGNELDLIRGTATYKLVK